MNKNTLIAASLVLAAVVSAGLLVTSAGDLLTACVGKAAWYLPYAALVGAIRAFRLA